LQLRMKRRSTGFRNFSFLQTGICRFGKFSRMSDYCTDKDHTQNIQPNPTSKNCYYCGKERKPSNTPLEELEIRASADRRSIVRTTKVSKPRIKRGPYFLISLSKLVIIGDSEDFQLVCTPCVTLRARRIFSNALAPSMFLIKTMLTANINDIQAEEWLDTHVFYGRAGMSITSPIVTPANRISFQCRYTGYVPQGYPAGAHFHLNIALRGRGMESSK
jgi:hypothetical protein